jgi:hypothetical protein
MELTRQHSPSVQVRFLPLGLVAGVFSSGWTTQFISQYISLTSRLPSLDEAIVPSVLLPQVDPKDPRFMELHSLYGPLAKSSPSFFIDNTPEWLVYFAHLLSEKSFYREIYYSFEESEDRDKEEFKTLEDALLSSLVERQSEIVPYLPFISVRSKPSGMYKYPEGKRNCLHANRRDGQTLYVTEVRWNFISSADSFAALDLVLDTLPSELLGEGYSVKYYPPNCPSLGKIKGPRKVDRSVHQLQEATQKALQEGGLVKIDGRSVNIYWYEKILSPSKALNIDLAGAEDQDRLLDLNSPPEESGALAVQSPEYPLPRNRFKVKIDFLGTYDENSRSVYDYEKDIILPFYSSKVPSRIRSIAPQSMMLLLR